MAMSVASTVVLIRMLMDNRMLDSVHGHVAVGWLIVQDIFMILVLVLLPVFADALKGAEGAVGRSDLFQTIALTFGKIAAFLIIMLVVGRKLIPAVLHYVAHTGSRELFRLAVLSIALGVAAASAELFGVSLALGAFFAGMILSESRLSQQAAQESLPLRDAFAVLFFVSVGMLFDPQILIEAPGALFATVFIILIAKSAAAYLVVRIFGHSAPSALSIAISLAQIGEFSFILAGKGLALDLIPAEARDLILAGAIVSILLNPLLMELFDQLMLRRMVSAEDVETGPEPEARGREPIPVTRLKDHVVLVGHGRVGSVVSDELRKAKIPFLVVESDEDSATELRKLSIETITGNAADPEVVRATNLAEACCLLVAIPDAFEGGQVVEQARAANPDLLIIARAHSDEEVEHLKKHGATTVIMGEFEIARAMIEDVREAVLPLAKSRRETGEESFAVEPKPAEQPG
jgi:CPA2 family monovalent cation:H+ antiporter-2